ncbi:MAG: FG-GAP repeat domain-containing protein [Candidatus Methylomirabilales bacterium]
MTKKGLGVVGLCLLGGVVGLSFPAAGSEPDIEAFAVLVERTFSSAEAPAPAVVVLEFVARTEEATQLFSAVRAALVKRLLETGRLRVVDEEVVRAATGWRSKGFGEILSPAGLKRLADELEIHGVILGSPGPAAGSLRLRAIETRRGALVVFEEVQLGPSPRRGEKKAVRSPRPSRPRVDPRHSKVRKTVAFEGGILSLDVGDTDGDGRKEILFTEGDNVWLVPLEGDRGEPRKIYEAKGKGRLIHVAVADVNRNGRAEIFVTRHGSRAVRSFVIEHNRTRYRELSGVLPGRGVFLHVAGDWDGDGVADLFWQQSGVSDPFMNSIRRAIWSNGRYVEAPFPRLRERVSLYTLSVFDWDGDGRSERLILDRHRRPALYSSDGRLIATATRKFEATPIRIYPQQEGREFAFKGSKVLAVDLNGDGRNEILLANNILRFGRAGLVAVPTLFQFKHGQLCALAVGEGVLESVGCSRMLGGYVGDFAVTPDGEVVVAVVERAGKSGWLGGPRLRSTLRILPVERLISRGTP